MSRSVGAMTSNRPYLLRAVYEWILDNRVTPHLLVDATRDGVRVPAAYVEDGKIVLNVLPGAVRELELKDDEVTFGARFGGAHFDVRVPIDAVLAIYARENGEGLAFAPEPAASPGGEAEPGGEAPEGQGAGSPPRPRGPGPNLRVVK